MSILEVMNKPYPQHNLKLNPNSHSVNFQINALDLRTNNTLQWEAFIGGAVEPEYHTPFTSQSLVK